MRNIDPSLLKKLEKNNQTKYEKANPRMSVAVARARNAVMDSTYWVREEIRTGPNLGDVSVAPRRMRRNGPPNRIYEIHVYNGEVRTSIREYPDKFKDGFKHQFTIGQGSNVAIAFDGEWQRHRASWRLVTHEKPWIFWVTNGELFTQHWDDEDTRRTLASNVIFCKAIRGWKNLNMADKDQGIVVGYIKSDGKVYYRNYCQLLDLSYTWEPERQVTEFTGTALSLNLFITNDYRMGFVVEDSLNDIYWYITDRNWAGMAISADTLSVAPAELSVDLIPIQYYDGFMPDETISVAPAELGVTLLYGDTDNDFKAMNAPKTMLDELNEPYEDWGWIIDLTIDHPIPSLTLANVTATNLDNSTVIQMASIEKVDDFNYRLHVSDVVESGLNNVYGDIQVDITGAINPAGYTYISMTHTFTPINLVPTLIPVPEVEVIYNE